MDELLKFAKDGNADQVYAILESSYQDDEALDKLRRGYENGYVEDDYFCQVVETILYFRHGK
jgi:hypothetical protein